MKKFFSTFFGIFCINIIAYAAQINRPPNLEVNGNSAVFVDFKTAHYEISYDTSLQKAVVKTQIDFESFEEGMPIFDSIAIPSKVILNGQEAMQIQSPLPGNRSSIRIVQKLIPPGLHRLILESEIINLIEFSGGSVKSAFWMNDLSERAFLEKFLPSNLEYDNFKIDFHILIEGSRVQHKIFTNGLLDQLTDNEWKINFPEYFTTSSVFYHLTPEDSFKVLNSSVKSIAGREIPITVYAKTEAMVESFQKQVLRIFASLESQFGPWRHPSITVYAGDLSGGMEYCGATVTSLWALEHELTHSYFARGLMPANGDAGWLDEAITSWRDRGFGTTQKPWFESSNMGARGAHIRATDKRAYDQGANFIAYLNFLSSPQGGLIPFLNQLLSERLFQPLTTQEFQKSLENFVGYSLEPTFSKFIYGVNVPTKERPQVENPYHPSLSDQELKELL